MDMELRRGALILNGSALIAIIGLLSARLPAATVHDAAWNFFNGLMVGLVSWLVGEAGVGAHAASFRAAARLNRHRHAESGSLEQYLTTPAGQVDWWSVNINGVVFEFTSLLIAGWSGALFATGCSKILVALPSQ
jgi:hypothetical protein